MSFAIFALVLCGVDGLSFRGQPSLLQSGLPLQQNSSTRQEIISGLLPRSLSASLTSALGVSIFCAALGCIAFTYDRRAFKRDVPSDAAIVTVSLMHLFSVLSSSVMVPASYQLMMKLGASAAFSGLYVGVYNLCWGVVANVCVWLLMHNFPNLWRKSKLLLATAVAMQLVGVFAYNSILFAADSGSKAFVPLRSLAVLSRVVMGTGAGIVSYVWRFLIVHLCPAKDRPKANMIVPFVNMIGNGLGPFVLAIAQVSKFPSPSLASKGDLFVCNGAPQIFFACALFILLAKFPSLDEVHDCDAGTSYSGAPAQLEPEGSSAWDSDIPIWRKTLLGACVTFSILWGLAFGGLEVAMVQILIEEFSLSISVACVLISATILAVVPLKLLFNVKYLHIKSWIHLLMGLSLLGAIMLFGCVGKLNSNAQIAVLLMADTLIFPAFSFAWGLCDGIAVQHAAKRGCFDSSNIIMASQIGFSTTRLAGSMLSRLVLTAGGRNLYASQQVLTTLVAWSTAAILITPYLDGKTVEKGWTQQNSIESVASSVRWSRRTRQHSGESMWSRQGSKDSSWSRQDSSGSVAAPSEASLREGADFDAEMQVDIPGWSEVIALCTSTVEQMHGQNARILSFWVGMGEQFDAYLKRGWAPDNLFGMNYSESLHDLVQERIPSVKFALVWEGSRPYDPRDDGPFDVVQMLWSLHFEHPQQPERRVEVLCNVFESLSAGGTLLLTEKTTQTPEIVEEYHDFKRRQGVSEKTIEAKSRALVGVLETLPKEWYTKALADVGFIDVSIIHEKLCFVTWLARKPAT